MTDLSQAAWKKATLSAHNGGCVEIAALRGRVGIRDSQNPGAGAHVVNQTAWSTFLADAQAGHYDI